MRAITLFLCIFFSATGFAQNNYLFIGTYTGTGSKGIYVYKFDAATGTAEPVSNTEGVENPSYLAFSPDGNYLYAVNETGGTKPGKVSAFAFDKRSGQLTFLNQQLTGGDHPCYVSVSKNGKWAVVGNYSGGNLSAFPLQANGSLKPYAQLIQHTGSSVHKNRQEKAHVHMAAFSPDYRYVFTPDLGLDKIMIYEFNPSAQQPLKEAKQPFVSTEGGSGPRHFTFHPNGRYAYLVEELTGTVSAFQYKNGQLTFLQKLSSHPQGYSGAIGSADIHVSPDGRFLYASNRGDANSIALFALDPASGKMQFKGVQPTGGKTPRNFMIDATGNFLLVANQESDNVVIFKRDKETGMLTPTGKEIRVPKPVCLKMQPVQ